MALEEGFTAEEQAQFDAMRAADNASDTGGDQAAAAEPAIVEPTADGADDGGQQQQPRPQTVPLAALHEERERRKGLEAQIAEERRARQTLEERTNLILQRFNPQPQPAQPEAPVVPEFDKDPAGHIVGKVNGLEQALNLIASTIGQQQQQSQQQQAIAAVTQRAVAMEHQFRATNPDYDAAAAHLTSERHKELEAIGHTDPATRQAIINNDAIMLADFALRSGKNPAEVIYSLSQQRGYKPAQAEGQTDATAGQEQSSAAATRMQTLAAGQEQARSLGTARGAAPAPLTAQRLAEMSEAEFAKIMNTPEARALMGA